MSEHQPLEQKGLLSNRLTRAATAVGRVTSQVHKSEHGLTTPEFNVLMILGSTSGRGSITSSDIVEATAMDKTKVSRAVSSLDQRGWLDRERASSDRRFEFLSLTEDGQKAYQKLMPKVESAEGTLLQHLTDKERDSLEIGLSGLDRALGR
ncbi:MarR family winged helix-turn-helix transcriptional regulator [Mangrovicella endophytica]|uniref:MarR family winged helix-turn-helix transcriptional regulator n=1 Tax=Mangrovicella endophytica TaxID=2066697 RepID=UPI000C9E48A3|nr:MarR family transcriptional regulator [Mangrovicella endophytica]